MPTQNTNEYGFKLRGKTVASRLQTGNRKADNAPFCIRISMISTGANVYTYTESLDPTSNPKTLSLDKEIEITDITNTRTENNIITINGTHTFK